MILEYSSWETGQGGVGNTKGSEAGGGFPRRLAWSSRRGKPGQPRDHGLERRRGDVRGVT